MKLALKFVTKSPPTSPKKLTPFYTTASRIAVQKPYGRHQSSGSAIVCDASTAHASTRSGQVGGRNVKSKQIEISILRGSQDGVEALDRQKDRFGDHVSHLAGAPLETSISR
jgi:hypothetical protein